MNDDPLQNARVLVVDDVPANLGALSQFLEQAGANVFVAQSGEAALARLAAVRPDLILLDVMMPGLGGMEVCRRIKEDTTWHNVPVIFITALGDVTDKVSGFAAGGVDYVVKPFQAEEVLARVSAHLSIRALQVALQRKNEDLEREMQRRLATERAMQRSLDRAVLVATRQGELRFCSDRAAELIERYFPNCAPGCVPAALVAERPIPGLRAQHSMRADTTEVLWLLEEVPPEPKPAMLETLGLTPREAEILYWVALGKTNAEISLILETAENTVKKHVYNVLPKLGVETRISAALRAMEILGLPS